MFSLLSPFSLWLGAALAVPLAIHFLGRQQLRKQPFPSLLLVRDLFTKSMHRHKLKNILLLLIRTLLILCLLFALANPVLNSLQVSSAHPRHSVALIHNGIYGRLASEVEKSTLEEQRVRLRALDSAEGTHTQSIPLIEDGPGTWAVSERFGNYGEGLSRLLTALGSKPGMTQIHIPVYAWSDLDPAKASLIRALKENPGLQIAITDYGDVGAKVQAFLGMQATPAYDGPTIKLVAQVNPNAPGSELGKLQVYLNGQIFQESVPEGSHMEVTVPLGDGPQTSGKLSLPHSGFAAADYFFCFPDAGNWKMAHSGSVLASLPSLGRETYFRRIEHVATIKNIPWSAGSENSKLKLVYLANERSLDPSDYAQAVEFVKKGGRLIIGVGQESDIPMLNRFLLQPLRLGRLGNIIESPASSPVSINRVGLAKLGRLPNDLGSLGGVHKRFAFVPDSGCELLLLQTSQAPTPNPGVPGTSARQANAVLVARDFHRGKVLLWTTDIDDLNWCDLGVSPITPLLHQALQETGSEARARNLSIASDSILTLTLVDGPFPSGRPATDAATPVEIRDPGGKVFSKVRVDGNRLHLGPFDQLGIYRVIQGQDTSQFAVNLAGRSGSSQGTQKSSSQDWRRVNQLTKAAWLKDLADFSGRLHLQSSNAPASTQALAMTLWPKLFLAAILLLFLEGMIASAFSLIPRRQSMGQ